MRLLELTEPLFQYVCRLNRGSRKTATVDFDTVRAEIRQLLADMAERAKADPRINRQFEAVEPAMVYFVDDIIATSPLPFAEVWSLNRLAYERGELAGNQAFFVLLGTALSARGDGTEDVLAVFYTCLGLGFVGWLAGQPQKIQEYMTQIAPRIRHLVENDAGARLCPDAYEANTADLPRPVGPRLIGIVIVFTGLLLVVAAANIYLFHTSSADLHRALEEITQHDPGVPETR